MSISYQLALPGIMEPSTPKYDQMPMRLSVPVYDKTLGPWAGVSAIDVTHIDGADNPKLRVTNTDLGIVQSVVLSATIADSLVSVTPPEDFDPEVGIHACHLLVDDANGRTVVAVEFLLVVR